MVDEGFGSACGGDMSSGRGVCVGVAAEAVGEAEDVGVAAIVK